MARAGALTTHVLDTANGTPAASLRIDLYRLDGGERTQIARVTSNDDGRTNGPLLEGDAFAPGTYELVFHVGAYFSARAEGGEEPPFLDRVPVRFGVADPAPGYHVPLLVAPYGYSTYRGS